MNTDFIVINKFKTEDASEKEEAVTKIVEKLINSKFEQEMTSK